MKPSSPTYWPRRPPFYPLAFVANAFGYGFIWLGQNTPCFITPGGYVFILLEVELDIPYLQQGTQAVDLVKSATADIDDVLATAGLCRWYGKIALDLDIEMVQDSPIAVPATEAASSSNRPVHVGIPPRVDGDVAAGDPPCPLIDEDEKQPGKMSDAEAALSDIHLGTHKPYNPMCEVCTRAKMRNLK